MMRLGVPWWALMTAACIGETGDEGTMPSESWEGAVRLHVVLPTMDVGEQSPMPVLQPIDEEALRGLVDVPTFIHHGEPDVLEESLDGCGVESETDLQIPSTLGGPFSDVLLLGDCGGLLADSLQTIDFDRFFASQLTEVLFAGSPDLVGQFPGDLRTRIQTWRSAPPRAADCYDGTILDGLCLGCEIVETTRGFTGPYGEPLETGSDRACFGDAGSTGGFGAYDLYDADGATLVGNLFYRSADHVVGEGLEPLPPTLSQADADNWRWEPGVEWPDAFIVRPRIDGYVSPLAGDPPRGAEPVGWQAMRHAPFEAVPEWPAEADRIYVLEKRGEPVVAILVDLDLTTTPASVLDLRWFARTGETEDGLLPAEERTFNESPNFFLADGADGWRMARTPPLPPERP